MAGPAFTVRGLFHFGVRRGSPDKGDATLLLPIDRAGATLRDDPFRRPDGDDRHSHTRRVVFTHRGSARDQSTGRRRPPGAHPCGPHGLDANGKVAFANAAARSLQIDRLEPLQWAITRALLTEDNVREDEIAIAPLGEPRRLISAHIIPVRAPKLGVNAAFVVLSDVTARTQVAAWTPMIETLVRL